MLRSFERILRARRDFAYARLEVIELVNSVPEFALRVQGVAARVAAEVVEVADTGTVLPDDAAAALKVAWSVLVATDNADWSVRADKYARAKRNSFELVVPCKYDLIVTFFNNYWNLEDEDLEFSENHVVYRHSVRNVGLRARAS